MTGGMVLVLGGARSGKSTYAQELAKDIGGDSVLYVATAEPLDDEMRVRIAHHRAERPQAWRTLEAARRVGESIESYPEHTSVVLIDCLTVLASNVVLALGDEPTAQDAERAVLEEVEAILRQRQSGHATWIIVSNEVGLGLVPSYPLGRTYRDALGRANQRLAAEADQVLFMVAGLPLKLK